MSNLTTKICTKCGNEYPATLEHFHKNKSGKYGLMAECVTCNNERAKISRIENPEKHRTAVKKWRENNADHVKEYTSAYYKANKEKMNTQNREWREANREYDLERKRKWQHDNKERSETTSRIWRLNNPERVKELRRTWYLNNTDHAKNYNKAWIAGNKERVREYGRKRYANNREQYSIRARAYKHRKRANGGSFTIAQIRALLELQNGCCLYCGVNIRGGYEIDHYLAVSRGGSNDITNLVLACHDCNSSKGDKLVHEWYRMRLFV